MHWLLLAIKTQETTDLVEHGMPFVVCLFPVVNGALFVQKNSGFGQGWNYAMTKTIFARTLKKASKNCGKNRQKLQSLYVISSFQYHIYNSCCTISCILLPGWFFDGKPNNLPTLVKDKC